MGRTFCILSVLLLLAACVRVPVTGPELALDRPSWWRSVAPGDDLGFRDLAAAVHQSLIYFQKLPPDTSLTFGPDRVTALDMTVTLQNFLLIIENGSLSPEQKLRRIKEDFEFYRSVGSNGRGKVLFTGYYEPVLSCRTQVDDVFKYPLYRKPDDIVAIDLSLFGNDLPHTRIYGRLDNGKVVPYYSRQEIDGQRVLNGRGLEILWCSDPVDIYFLQVQGSGKADLGDGNFVNILYDGQNGRPYRSIGRYLIDAGAITKENMSMQALREYLKTHPDELSPVLNQNQSYVFFRIDTAPSVGSIGVPLTAGRSIATDSRLFPRGALALIVTQKPLIVNGVIKDWQPFTRFALNQDTGGAIRGPGRVDLFWGQGDDAEIAAGYMQQEGKLYFLLRKK